MLYFCGMRSFPNPRRNMFPATALITVGDDIVWTEYIDPDWAKENNVSPRGASYKGVAVEVHEDHAIATFGGRLDNTTHFVDVINKDGKVTHEAIPPYFEEGIGELVRVEDPRKSYWFTLTATKIFEDKLGLPPINPGKFRDLLDFADTDIELWSYLASLTNGHPHLTDEVVNFILGPLAATLKERSGNPEKGGVILGFRDRDKIVPEDAVVEMFEAIAMGLVPKSIRKELDAFMVREFITKLEETEADYRHWAIRMVFWDKMAELMEGVLAAASVDIGAMVDKVLADNPKQAAAIKDDPKLIGWCMGQVMRASPTKLDPNEVRAVIENKIAP